MKSKMRILGAVMLAISIALLIWGYAPGPREVRVQMILPHETKLNETRRLTLDFPPTLRVGAGSEIMSLRLEVEDTGGVPEVYDTHKVIAEAQLDLAGVTVQPPNAVYAPLQRGQSATFVWHIAPQQAGTYRGTVWLHLNFENRSTGENERVAVSAQIVEIRACNAGESLCYISEIYDKYHPKN